MGLMWSLLFGKKHKPPTSPDKTVLVVGGGVAGLSAMAQLRKLDPDVKIVLVEPKDHAEIYWATYRSPFEDWVAKGSLIRLDRFCEAHHIQHVRARLTRLVTNNNNSKCDSNSSGSGGTATLSNGGTVDYHVCLVAVGAAAHWPALGRGPPSSPEGGTAEHRLAALKAEGQRLLNASSIAVLGGGLIGSELAGDIASYAQKAGKAVAVTLIQSKSQLCADVLSPAAANKLQQLLQARGVTVILNERANETKPGTLLLASGNEIQADIVIKTTGFTPVNDFLKDSGSSSVLREALDDKGWIQTDEFFRIPHSNGIIFAFGDCSSNLPNSGSLYLRAAQGLAHNIQATLLGTPTALKSIEKPMEAYCVTAGPNHGVFYTSAFWTQYIFPKIKNRTMFFMSPRDMASITNDMTMAAADAKA